jgi:hypothetical protein
MGVEGIVPRPRNIDAIPRMWGYFQPYPVKLIQEMQYHVLVRQIDCISCNKLERVRVYRLVGHLGD